MNNKEILDKVDDLIHEIETSSDYQKYLKLKEDISNNKELVLLINEVRQMNKDFVHKLVDKKELDKKTDKLNNHPLYREYLNTINSINNELVIIENTINKYFSRIME
ncbi:MAG: YlbF family regulator [Bacilli bacterium]|nr:YlbF family regulator [Bacilli bacterium]